MQKLPKHVAHVVFSALLVMLSAGAQVASAAPGVNGVRMSSSGICHCPGGEYYDRTSSSKTFSTINACLSDGGRHPQRGQGNCDIPAGGAVPAPTPSTKAVSSSAAYDRDLFGGWADQDGDCQNTRHELLASLSTGRVLTSADGCYVQRGRWNDPYTGKIFLEARQMDVDHLVPLAYAWSRGADKWDRAKRVAFANDPANLFAVDASTNRQKGASGPTEWMPPSREFHCQYLLRFTRISKQYGLVFSAREAQSIDSMTSQACQ